MGVATEKCYDSVFPDASGGGGDGTSASKSLEFGRLLLVPAASFQVSSGLIVKCLCDFVF